MRTLTLIATAACLLTGTGVARAQPAAADQALRDEVFAAREARADRATEVFVRRSGL